MKVLVLYNDYLQAGGERKSVSIEVQALRDLGHRVELFRVDNHRLDAASSLSKFRSTFPSTDSRRNVSSIINDFAPQIVHAENLFPLLGAGAVSAIQEAKLPWIRTIRNYRRVCIAGTLRRDNEDCTLCLGRTGRLPGVIHACYRGSLPASIGATNYAAWDRRAENAYPPARYLVVSSAMKRSLDGCLNPTVPVEVVHNAVDQSAVPQKEMSERQYDAGFFGRFEEEKGISLALEVAVRLPHRRFVFAGVGALTGEVEAAARTAVNIDYAGQLSSEAAGELMTDVRVALVPSLWAEPFGRVAVEAMAHGALPLVSGSGGLSEIVQHCNYAAIEPSLRADSWSKSLDQLLSRGPAELNLLSFQVRERQAKNFSSISLATRLIEIYAEVIS